VHLTAEEQVRLGRPRSSPHLASCGAGRIADRPEAWSISPNAPLSLGRGYARAVLAESTRGPAFVRREVSRVESARPCMSPTSAHLVLASRCRLAANACLTRPARDVFEPPRDARVLRGCIHPAAEARGAAIDHVDTAALDANEPQSRPRNRPGARLLPDRSSHATTSRGVAALFTLRSCGPVGRRRLPTWRSTRKPPAPRMIEASPKGAWNWKLPPARKQPPAGYRIKPDRLCGAAVERAALRSGCG
jgi:hypothetical protein